MFVSYFNFTAKMGSRHGISVTILYIIFLCSEETTKYVVENAVKYNKIVNM